MFFLGFAVVFLLNERTPVKSSAQYQDMCEISTSEAALGQLWGSSRAALGKLWGSSKAALGQLWGSSEVALGQVWDSSRAALGQL
jgi:hypothetical protein